MKLSARSRYAARLLLDLARDPGETPVCASALAAQTGITVQFVEQILRPLRQAGIIRSVRGAQGGHVLVADPAQVSLGDVVRTMEGDISIARCDQDPDCCERSADCPTRRAWQRVSGALARELDAIRLSDLLRDSGPLLDESQA